MVKPTASTPLPGPSRRRCSPRHWVSQGPGIGDLAAEVAEFAKLTPYGDLGWQFAVLELWSAYGDDGKWVHRRCGASVPRQAGKSVVAIVWVAFLVVVMGYKVLWTDHNYSTTCEMLARFRKMFGHHPGDSRGVRPINRHMVRSVSKTAQECFEFDSGGVLVFSTRTQSATLGYSFDVIVLDEAQELLPEHLQAILPTTSAGDKHNAQFIYLGTPTRAGSRATSFANLRDEALSDDRGSDLCWVEYGAGEVGDVLDTDRLYGVNPSLGEGRADLSAIEAGIRGMLPDELAAAQEYYGYWLPKAGAAVPVIGADAWEACAVSAPPQSPPAAFGVKFSPDGDHVAVGVAVIDGDRSYVELADVRPTAKGVGWLAEAIVSKAGECDFIIDGKSGAQALYDRVKDSVPFGSVSLCTTAQAVSAPAGMLNEINEGSLSHIKTDGSDRLSLSVASSPKRSIGSGGGWGFGGSDPAPVEAVALALLAARKRMPAGCSEMEVYY